MKMKRINGILLVLSLLAISCSSKGIKKQPNNKPEKESEISKENSGNNVLDQVSKVVDKLELKDGVIIKWVEHGSGEKIESGDCILIDYKVFLDDNTVVDGNHLIDKESIPYMVGFNMQTEGWFLALKEMKVGDFAEIFIPSDLARGEKGIKDLIPPNADNTLKIRILEKPKPTREIDGNKVWVFEENESNKRVFNESNDIEFHCMVSTNSNPLYVNTYRTGNIIKMSFASSGYVPGLKKALINAKKSDRMFVFVPSKEAYRSQGYRDVVGPNEDLFYNILVMNITDH